MVRRMKGRGMKGHVHSYSNSLSLSLFLGGVLFGLQVCVILLGFILFLFFDEALHDRHQVIGFMPRCRAKQTNSKCWVA
jgi:hypothetical protein